VQKKYKQAIGAVGLTEKHNKKFIHPLIHFLHWQSIWGYINEFACNVLNGYGVNGGNKNIKIDASAWHNQN